MYFLLKMGIFHGYVSLPEGRYFTPFLWADRFWGRPHKASKMSVPTLIPPMLSYFRRSYFQLSGHEVIAISVLHCFLLCSSNIFSRSGLLGDVVFFLK